MARAWIGLGSNLGDRKAALESARKHLADAPHVRVRRVSSFVQTAPVGGPPQPDYLNAVAEVETSLSPAKLLELCLDIETRLGRERTTRWGPRTIDLDLLLYDDRVIDLPHLQLPHPRMHERAFVLKPLAELAPGRRHPVTGRSVREMLAALDDQE